MEEKEKKKERGKKKAMGRPPPVGPGAPTAEVAGGGVQLVCPPSPLRFRVRNAHLSGLLELRHRLHQISSLLFMYVLIQIHAANMVHGLKHRDPTAQPLILELLEMLKRTMTLVKHVPSKRH